MKASFTRHAVAVFWLALVFGGMALLWRYKLTPGPEAHPAAIFPENALVTLASPRATIVMLAHPKCTCTRASIDELAVLMGRLHGQAAATVLFVRPEGVEDAWEQSDTFLSASRIPGVSVRVDAEGRVASKLGATVSGHTLVYDAQGHLLYSGGITAARGHAGDNAGRERIVALLGGATSTKHSGPTFGCDLSDPSPTGGR
jgi:hypothetical protein